MGVKPESSRFFCVKNGLGMMEKKNKILIFQPK